MKALIPRRRSMSAVEAETTFRAEGFDDRPLQAIFARSTVEIEQLDGVEAILEPFDQVAAAHASRFTASSAERGKWWARGSKRQMVQLAPILVVVVAMHRPLATHDVRVVSASHVGRVQEAHQAEYVEPAVRYPVLMRAIEKGRLQEAGRPDPRERELRDLAEPELLTSVQQVAFGKLGDPPSARARRPRLP
jgi:hypothetical protein